MLITRQSGKSSKAPENGERRLVEPEIVVLSGSDFLVSDGRGDVNGQERPNGLFVRDMRHLSTWRLLVDGQATRLLSGRALGHDTALFVLTPGRVQVGHDSAVSIQRRRRVDGHFLEEVQVDNHSGVPRRVLVDVEYGADFADVFEVKDPRPKLGTLQAAPRADGITLRYQRDSFWRATEIAFEPLPAAVTEHAASFVVDLPPGGRWSLRVQVRCSGEGLVPAADEDHDGQVAQPDGQTAHLGARAADPDGGPARLLTDLDSLRRTYRQSLTDLAALRFRPFADRPWSPPAAGLPWFMALFGRDSLLTSYQALPFDASLAASTLQSLARLQATELDDFRDAEPGKILHEFRSGEMVRFGEEPQGPYYGTHDATPLFLVLLDEYERWTGDLELVRRLEAPARAALEWIERFGDLDGDGYLEYARRSPRGLDNQFWKDSWNSVLFADGRLAEAPIATCDLQGYAYDAYRRTARLARLAWGDPALAERLQSLAAALRRRFNDDFWSESRGHYVLALDGRKRQVDALTSNVGHLLWTGIADDGRAAATVERLMRPDMFSGWGIRTMSALDAGHNPISYHNGTVWPHDTGIVAEGFRRYGFREEASRLAISILEAARHFDGRLPEALAGFARESGPFPVIYPTASRPQGWAAGAPLLAIRTLLGLDVDGRLQAEPWLPPALPSVELCGLTVRGVREDVIGRAQAGR